LIRLFAIFLCLKIQAKIVKNKVILYIFAPALPPLWELPHVLSCKKFLLSDEKIANGCKTRYPRIAELNLSTAATFAFCFSASMECA